VLCCHAPHIPSAPCHAAAAGHSSKAICNHALPPVTQIPACAAARVAGGRMMTPSRHADHRHEPKIVKRHNLPQQVQITNLDMLLMKLQGEGQTPEAARLTGADVGRRQGDQHC
jgi:hypothetical protein